MTAISNDLEATLSLEAVAPAPQDTPIFVVDDDPQVLSLIIRYLKRRGYPVEGFASAVSCLEALSGRKLALIIADLSMPEVGGLELVRSMLEIDPDIAVIILTGVPDSDSAVESLRLGVTDFLTKPVDLPTLEETVARALRRRAQRLYRRSQEERLRLEVTKRNAELRRIVESELAALVRAIEAKDNYLRGDGERVAKICEGMARLLSIDADEVQEIRIGGLLRDIGMISVPESLLHKKSKLTADEYQQVKKHAEVGAEILEPMTHLGRASEFVRYHHERLNGSGYPEGKEGEQIPLGARIVGLADAYVALTADRPYRAACSSREALETLAATQGIWFEASLLEALTKVVNADPRVSS